MNCACSLYAGLQGHGDKRNGAEIGSLDPGPLDVEQVMHAVATYGDPAKAAKAAVIGSGPGSRAKSLFLRGVTARFPKLGLGSS